MDGKILVRKCKEGLRKGSVRKDLGREVYGRL